MSGPRFTPGPLKVERGAAWYDREVWTDGPGYTRPICTLSDSEADRDEIEANARLFAAAPELYEALVRAESLIAMCVRDGLLEEQADHDTLATARAALAKVQP